MPEGASPSATTLASLARPFLQFIGGEWCAASDGAALDSVNPADESPLASFPAGTASDIDRAVAAARMAFNQGRWSNLMPGERARLMWRVADLLESRAEEFAELETLDNGKPVVAARTMDVPAAVSVLRYWSGWCTKIHGETPMVDLPGQYLATTAREPVGVVGLIVPWNFPLVMAAAKLGPALAAGCTVVLKPAEQTSLTAIRLVELFEQAGFPAGVVNLVTGRGDVVGAALAEHADVDKISFTGSTEVGKQILGAARGNLKRLTLELGGKSPTIILADADLERATQGAANAIFRNAGQMCAAGSRLYVARAVFDRVMDGVVALAAAHRLGPGLEPGTTMGPLVSGAQRSRVLRYIESARRDGALVLGGEPCDGPGFFVAPTVLVDAPPGCAAVRDEIFGPVLVASAFDDVSEVVSCANDTVFGLSASVWTRDLSLAHRMARQLRAGTVTINSGMVTGPGLSFGGFKQSGWGREGGAEGLHAFTETKTTVTAL